MANENEKKFCPKIEPVNNNAMDLSYEERLSIVEKDVLTLHDFCMEKKFSPKEIYKCVSNMRGPEKPIVKKALHDSAKPFFILSVIVCVLAALLMQEKIWALAIIHLKLFSVKVVLPYWDWSSLYSKDCMFENIWLPEKVENLTAKECTYCEKFSIERVEKVTQQWVTKIVAGGDTEPFIVTDVMKDWKNSHQLSIDEIQQIYLNHPAMVNTLEDCAYNNSVGLNNSFYDFFKAYNESKLPLTWHATWVTCDPKAAKVIRRYHPRPYFLPLMMQLRQSNSMITSMGVNPNDDERSMSNIYDKNKQEEQGIWNAMKPQGQVVTVISGALNFILKPPKECISKFGCVESTFNVLPGESLFYFTMAWEAYYKPSSSDVTVAVINDVSWDDMS